MTDHRDMGTPPFSTEVGIGEAVYDLAQGSWAVTVDKVAERVTDLPDADFSAVTGSPGNWACGMEADDAVYLIQYLPGDGLKRGGPDKAYPTPESRLARYPAEAAENVVAPPWTMATLEAVAALAEAAEESDAPMRYDDVYAVAAAAFPDLTGFLADNSGLSEETLRGTDDPTADEHDGDLGDFEA